MPLRTETTVIEGDPPLQVTLTQLPAMRALDLFIVLGRTFGPAFLSSIELDPEKDISELAPLVQQLFVQLGTNGDGRYILTEIMSSAAVRPMDSSQPPVVCNTQQNIDAIFGGRIQDILRIVRMGLVLNYGNFRDIISGLVGSQAMEKLKAEGSNSPEK